MVSESQKGYAPINLLDIDVFAAFTKDSLPISSIFSVR